MKNSVFQMIVRFRGGHKGANLFQATNPYTGRYYSRWDDDAPWKNRDEEGEDQKEVEPVDQYGNDRRDYGMGWYDCNTDWRQWR